MADNTKQKMLIDVIESLPCEACLFDTSLTDDSIWLPFVTLTAVCEEHKEDLLKCLREL